MQKILQARSNVKKINDARDKEVKAQNNDDDDPQVFGQAKNAMTELEDINKNVQKNINKVHEVVQVYKIQQYSMLTIRFL